MSSLSATTINDLEDLRTQTARFFDAQKLTARQVVSINTQTLPARIIAFQLYNSSELGANIASLNEDINVSDIAGEIEVFTT